jgi:surface protein
MKIIKKNKFTNILIFFVFFLSLFFVNILISNQAYAHTADQFVISVKTDNFGVSESTQFTIPTTGVGYNYNVDCDNDGINEAENQTGNYTCDYGSAGTYTIAISGTFPRIYFNNGGDKLKLLDIIQWGSAMNWTSFASAFFGCRNMTMSATDTPVLTGVTNMYYMFANASSLTTNPVMNTWNTSSITRMTNMFSGASSFNQDIGNWNTSSVRYMSAMFSSASSFNQDIGSWDINQVIDFTGFMQNHTGLSTTNYDATLAGWAGQSPLISGIIINFGGSKYCDMASRAVLTSAPNNWNITDGDIGTCTTFSISGQVKDYNHAVNSKVVPGATVILKQGETNIDVQTTDNTGTYEFTSIPSGNYTISVSKTTEPAGNNGLNTSDLTLIRRHILSSPLLDSVYKIIAANVVGEANYSINTSDLTILRRRIIPPYTSLGLGVWKFFKYDHSLTSTNYFDLDQQQITIASLSSNLIYQDFIAVKMGDVDNTWTN